MRSVRLDEAKSNAPRKGDMAANVMITVSSNPVSLPSKLMKKG